MTLKTKYEDLLEDFKQSEDNLATLRVELDVARKVIAEQRTLHAQAELAHTNTMQGLNRTKRDNEMRIHELRNVILLLVNDK